MYQLAPNTEELDLMPFLGYSVFMHFGLTVLLLLGVWIQRNAIPWGGTGGSGDSGVRVNLVSPAGINMPQPDVFSDSHAIDPTKGLAKEEPPKPPEIPTDAVKIPKFDKLKPPPPPSKPSKTLESKTPPAKNAIPYGKGGTTSLPTGYGTEPGPMSSATGVSIGGQGGAEFASRYPWYVASVTKRVQDNWMQNSIDPSVRSARTAHSIVTFTILRDGTVKNIQLAQSSGNRSMDDSGMRALFSIDKMPALPSDWRGQSVDVTFDFDLSQHR
jgi:TonB family protein